MGGSDLCESATLSLVQCRERDWSCHSPNRSGFKGSRHVGIVQEDLAKLLANCPVMNEVVIIVLNAGGG